MASLSRDTKRNGFRISFYSGPDKRKRVLWLGMKLLKGRDPEAQARRIHDHVEHLIGITESGGRVDKATQQWLQTIGLDLRKRLVNVGLIEPTADDLGPVTLGCFLYEYVASRKDVKDSTRATYRKTVNALVSYFGADRRLDSITAGDAEMWRVEQATNGNQRDRDRTEMEENSVRRRVGLARQFFRHAVKRKLIAENPFDGLPAAVRGNAKRQQFIPAETIYSALEHAACPQLRAVIGLSRFAGIRVPSEIVRLTWQDVDLEAGRLTIHAPKTEHHEDSGLRFCPIFPELRPFLQAIYDAANPGIDCPLSAPVITRWRSADQNIGTAFRKLLKQAGIKPWPKLFHNLRASRQTELLAEFPVKDVCEWIGNSQPVAMKHYAMATDDSFQRAINEPICCSTGCSIPDSQAASEAHAQNEEPPETKASEGSRDLVMSKSLGPAGLEPATNEL